MKIRSSSLEVFLFWDGVWVVGLRLILCGLDSSVRFGFCEEGGCKTTESKLITIIGLSVFKVSEFLGGEAWAGSKWAGRSTGF